jgi:hypothetical protein
MRMAIWVPERMWNQNENVNCEGGCVNSPYLSIVSAPKYSIYFWDKTLPTENVVFSTVLAAGLGIY